MRWSKQKTLGSIIAVVTRENNEIIQHALERPRNLRCKTLILRANTKQCWNISLLDSLKEGPVEDWKTEALGSLGFSDEQLETNERTRKMRVRDGGVCVCGHGARAHTENVAPGESVVHDAARLTAAGVVCAPSKVKCACLKYQGVIVAQDLRQFRHSTMGPGLDHALSQGIVASARKDKAVEWLPDVECVLCHRPRTTVGLVLVPIAYNGRVESHSTTQHNVLICQDCRQKIQDGV